VEKASLLLDHGADIHSVDDVGNTALMLAAEHGHTDVVELLIMRRPFEEDDDTDEWFDWLNALNADGDAALHIAVREGHVDCVQALIDGGAYPNLFCDDDEYCLPLQHTSDVAIARILLDAGAEYLRAEDVVDVITSACEDPARIEVLRLLLQRFPDSEPDEGSYLIEAASNQNLEAVQLLIEGKTVAYINKRDYLGRTALAWTDKPDMARLLLARGVDPRILNNQGQTPLMRVKGVSCVRLLLETDPGLAGIRDDKGRAATAHLSCSDEQFPMLVRLLQYCEEHGIDAEINNKDVNGDTALHMAMLWGINKTVKLLLEKGAEVLGSGCRGTTVLMKPFLEKEAVASEYCEIWCPPISQTKAVADAYANACLRLVLDAVLQRGGDADAMAADAGQDAEMEDEHAAKRRRIDYE
jgi:ankyrin repeat protein